MDNSHRQLEILFLPLSSAVAAMFPRQSGFRGRTPLLCLLIHGAVVCLFTLDERQGGLSYMQIHGPSHYQWGERCGDAAPTFLIINTIYHCTHYVSKDFTMRISYLLFPELIKSLWRHDHIWTSSCRDAGPQRTRPNTRWRFKHLH